MDGNGSSGVEVGVGEEDVVKGEVGEGGIGDENGLGGEESGEAREGP